MDLKSQPLGSTAQPRESLSRGTFWLKSVIVCVVPLLIFAVMFAPGYYAARAQGQLTGCKSNLVDLSKALQAYAYDDGGHFPKSLENLIQRGYLKSLPTCPAAAVMTYQDYRVSTGPDDYSLSCTGDNHQRVYQALNRPTANYPRLSSNEGLREP